MAGKQENASSVFGPIASAIQVVTGPWTRENGASWLRLVVIVLTVWWFFIQPFRIPTDSMVPTLNGDPGFFVGDRVFVNKLAFGPRIPFTTTRLWSWGHPKRFDIVVFRNVEPAPPATSPWGRAMNFLLPKVLIKRVIGLPGERVHIANGQVYINGEPLELPEELKAINVEYTNTAPQDQVMPLEEIERQVRMQNPAEYENVMQFVAERRAYYRDIRNQTMKYGCLPNEDEYSVVPPGHYFMLGDNSQSSLDGRYWGWVPEDHLFGRAFCVWWPIKNRKDLSGFTDTWWGLMLLWGIPGLLLGYEFIIRPFLAVSLRVRTPGFAGKLRRGDRILINRLAFGLRRPFSDKRLSSGRMPERGELVAYFVPNAEGIDYAGEALLGMVSGLPSDVIAVEGGVLLVNGQSTGVRADLDGKPSRIKRNATVPKGRYLILSGADEAAPDSRAFGFVPHELLIGAATAVWWPPQRFDARIGTVASSAKNSA